MAQKLLHFTKDAATARAEVEHLGGRITHQLSSSAFVVELPDNSAMQFWVLLRGKVSAK